jgi:hypothetical protein
MKRTFFILLAIVCVQVGFSQSQVSNNNTSFSFKLPALDKSPMDMAYYPANYPMLKIQDKATEPLLARLIYSRPQKDNRKIFGDLVEYNQVWRLGANEATELELYKDVTIQGKKLGRGRYTLYAVPFEDKWTVIFNKDTDVWGAFKYEEKKDALRVTIPIQKTTFSTDAFSATFNKSAKGADLVFAWDDVLATIPLSFK